jgi:hypothetical protein
MPDSAATGRDAARAAKTVVAESLAGEPGVVGIGLARLQSGYVVQVDLADEGALGRVPADVDGVPVVTRVVGVIRPL